MLRGAYDTFVTTVAKLRKLKETMASTVEQCESKSIGPLSSTLEMFDTFKNAQDDDKDSDEESFHLPLLGCDDDMENGKEISSGKDTPNEENEDDILNKFETLATPELDPKLEEHILNDDENISKINCNDTKVIDSNVDKNEEVAHEEVLSEKGSSLNDDGFFRDLELVDEIKDTSNNSEGIIDNLESHETENKNMEIENEEQNIDQVQKDENMETDKNKVNDEVERNDDNELKSPKNDIPMAYNSISNEGENISHKDDKIEIIESDEIEIKKDEKIELINEDEEIVINEDEKIVIKEDDKLEISEHEKIEKNEDEKIKINEDEKMEITENEKIKTNEAEKMEINEDKKIEINEDEIIEINDEKIEINEDEKIEINKDQKIELNEDEKLEINTDEKIEIHEDAKTDINEGEKKEIKEEQNSENKDSEKIEDNNSEKIQSIDSEQIKDNEVEITENKENVQLQSKSDVLEETKQDDSIDKIGCRDDVDNTEQEAQLLNKPDEINQDQSKDNIEDHKETKNDQEASKESVNAKDGMSETDNISTNLEEKVVDEAAKVDSAVAEVSKEKKEDEIAMDVDEPENIEMSNEKESTEKIDIGDSNKESDEKNNQAEKTETESDEKEFECDNLLDISVIRDVDEDDACAIAETTENHSSEKSDIDEQEDKQETETDDMELEQEDTQTSIERDEPMEFDDNTNSCDQETSTTDHLISENVSDSENKENEPVENVPNNNLLSVDDVTEIDSNQSVTEMQNEKCKDVSEKPLDSNDSAKPVADVVATSNPQKEEVPIKPIEETSEKVKENVVVNKRPLSQSEEEGAVAKKIRLDEKTEKDKSKKPEEKKKIIPAKNEKIKTLLNFEQFMKKRNLGEGKLTRSDLEQFCLQKICEAIMHKTEVGELHQTIKKQETIIENLRKDLAQLTKQTRDLDIVNRKLMNEMKTQNVNQKPLVPLKITRSVGLQVKLNLGTDTVNRRKSYTTNTPRTPNTPTTPNTPQNRVRTAPPGSNVVRQVSQPTPAASSPRKTPVQAPILTQALQTRTPPAVTKPSPVAKPAVNNKRPVTLRPKGESAKPSAPGVIDLTDEDDKSAKTVANNNNNNAAQKSIGNKTITAPVKLLNKNIMVQNKVPVAKPNNASPKTVVKTTGMQTKVGMQARAMTSLPQGVRLTTTQMKNGITIPASVVTSNAQGTTQLMYVVQPGSLVNTTAGGGQKAVLLNFQPTNGVLTSTINGSTVSVIPSKTTNSMQLKTMTMARKHPAALPLPPPSMINNSLKKLLPKPHLSIRKTDTGIILQWRMPYNLDEFEGIASYQLFAYQETNAPPSTDMWRKVGDVKALALPMACTLTQFADKNKYYFAVRSVDVHKRIGAFSDPEEISL